MELSPMYKGQPGKQDTTRISEEYEEPLICSPQQTQGKQTVALGNHYYHRLLVKRFLLHSQ